MNAVVRKSTTTEERYFHIRPKDSMHGNAGTVYFRQVGDIWHAAASRLSIGDTFSRKIGRTMAKRHYAKGDVVPIGTEEPTFDDALFMINEWNRR